jgi:cyclic pyranopterin phosphate synthase
MARIRSGGDKVTAQSGLMKINRSIKGYLSRSRRDTVTAALFSDNAAMASDNQHEKVITWPRAMGDAETVVHDRLRRPLRDLRISVMDRCNFRCPYCMPEDKYHKDFEFLKSSERLSFEEILRLAQLFAGLGVRKLRITGGEPLLRPGLPDLVGDLSRIEGIDDVALTTNGVLLAQHAAALKAAGLARVTVSLDSLDAAVFVAMNGGRSSRDRVLEGIREAISAGLTPLKINTVVIRGVNDGTVLDLVEHFRGTGVIVRFIEYMDVGTINHWKRSETVPSRELLRMIGERWPLRPVDSNYHGEVASRYAFDDGQGEVGFVSSVTEPFCGSCIRARLSSDGQLFTCLFASKGLDLGGPMRAGASDEELRATITGAWQRREDRYSELRAALKPGADKIEMYYIGG